MHNGNCAYMYKDTVMQIAENVQVCRFLLS